MKKITIGINGFGRIGRLVARVCAGRDDVEVVAVNDPFIDLEYAKYMLTHDSVHGKFNGTCEVEGDSLVVNGNKISFYAEREPELIPWGNVDVVIEATGKFTKYEDAVKHLEGGAKKWQKDIEARLRGKEMRRKMSGLQLSYLTLGFLFRKHVSFSMPLGARM